jgi:hypothetical protein
MFVDACMNHGVQYAVIDSVCGAGASQSMAFACVE